MVSISFRKNRLEIAGIVYDTNVLGFKGPRKMTGNTKTLTLIQGVLRIFFLNEVFLHLGSVRLYETARSFLLISAC